MSPRLSSNAPNINTKQFTPKAGDLSTYSPSLVSVFRFFTKRPGQLFEGHISDKDHHSLGLGYRWLPGPRGLSPVKMVPFILICFALFVLRAFLITEPFLFLCTFTMFVSSLAKLYFKVIIFPVWIFSNVFFEFNPTPSRRPNILRLNWTDRNLQQ